MNYASTSNIQEVIKFYNLGDKTFETDFSILASVSFWPLLIIELVARVVPARLINR